MQQLHYILQKLPKERLPKEPIWASIEKSGFAPHGSHGKTPTNYCNPFTGPPYKSIRKTMFWCNMLKAIPAQNYSVGFFGISMSSWPNPETAPPLVSMALDLLSTLQRLQGRTKV